MLKVRPGIMEIAPYVGGESGVEGLNRVHRLASNENPLGASPKAVEAYRAMAGELHRYPDGSARYLRQAIGEAEGLDPEQIVCGAGSDELISLLMRAYAGPGDEIIHSAHGFLMYAISARSVGARPVSAPEADLKADVDAIVVSLTPATRMVFLANPNNPTGSYLPASALAELRRRLPENVLLVIDAAYAEYVEEDDYANGAELVSANDNVVMLRTFSKIHGLAALRLGWAYCPPGIVDVLHRLRGPFNVGAPALAAGIAAVEDREHQERSRLHNRRLLSRFKSEVEALGLLAPPSYGNFILLRFPAGADQAEQALEALKSRGVLVRGMRGYGLQDSLRVTIGLEEEMKVTREALSEFLS